MEPLSQVEKRLVEHCARGAAVELGSERPKSPTVENTIRADLVRFLLLGGDDKHPVHEEGVMILGAWITDALNLHQVECQVRLDARQCHFDQPILATASSIPELSLMGSAFPGLRADRVKVKGGIFLDDVSATGEVRLPSAEVGSDLSCTKGEFSNQNGNALNADRINIKGGAFMNDGFVANGLVRMHSAEIGGTLACNGGKFSNAEGSAFIADRIEIKSSVLFCDGFVANGQVRMLGAKIGGNIVCTEGGFSAKVGDALSLDGASISDGLFLRAGSFAGSIDLTAAYAATLLDDKACYTGAKLKLDGFRYDRIIGPTDVAGRIFWLKRQRQDQLGSDFKPQPWEQLIRVLRDMGHPAEAAQIAMAKQAALRDARQIGQRQPNPAFAGWRLALDKGWSVFSNFLARQLHWFYGWIAGYGHRPARIVWRMALVCALCSLSYYGGRHYGLIGPSNPLIHLSQDLAHCGTGGDSGATYWTAPDCPVPPEYSTFQPFFYSLDVILPLIDLHQEADWAPVVTNSTGEVLWGGRSLRWIMWFEILFGWVASLMFVAIVGRLVDKD